MLCPFFSLTQGWAEGPALEQLLVSIRGKYGAADVLAHSMGNVAAGEALRLAAQGGAGSVVDRYVATQAAVSGHCYDPTLTNSDALSYSTGQGPDTPNIYNSWLASAGGIKANFYNINDFALNSSHWQLDQKLKPDIRGVSGNYQVYYYSSSDLNAVQDLFRTSYADSVIGAETIITLHTSINPSQALHMGTAANVLDRYQIMSYAAESRSKALGGVTTVAGFGGQNLQSLWPADTYGGNSYSAHPWHSAEFRFTNMDQNDYWDSLLTTFGLPTNP